MFKLHEPIKRVAFNFKGLFPLVLDDKKVGVPDLNVVGHQFKMMNTQDV